MGKDKIIRKLDSLPASVLRRSPFTLHSLRSLSPFTVHCLLFTVFVFFTLLFTLHSSRSLSFAADKLVVKDSEGNNSFVVTDTGKVGIGNTVPVQ